jgi:8-amino-7-oxononanoate synthase
VSWISWARRECDALRFAGLWREPRDVDTRGPVGRLPVSGQPIVSFASNDYLGLASHPKVVAAAREALHRWGVGAGAARLIVGSRPVHSELEREIADWKRTDATAIFATGYHANVGVLTALARPGTVVCSDELNHASIVDGCRLARAETRVYPHGDVAALESLLAGADKAIVVTETVFSMDGDVAPVEEIAKACRKHGALLVLDEAHAVLGPEPASHHTEMLRVGTLSKFLGAHGGYVAGPADLIELIVNRARPYIFTTATPPAIVAAAMAAVRIVFSEEGLALKARLRRLIGRVAPGHPSPIIPIVLGTEREAALTSARLLDRGILVPAIRPPSVPPGTARLRVTLSAAHTEPQVDALVDALRKTVPEMADA